MSWSCSKNALARSACPPRASRFRFTSLVVILLSAFGRGVTILVGERILGLDFTSLMNVRKILEGFDRYVRATPFRFSGAPESPISLNLSRPT